MGKHDTVHVVKEESHVGVSLVLMVKGSVCPCNKNQNHRLFLEKVKGRLSIMTSSFNVGDKVVATSFDSSWSKGPLRGRILTVTSSDKTMTRKSANIVEDHKPFDFLM